MDKPIENEYLPDWVSPPGETLQETLQALGMAQKELANRMGRPVKTINEIIKGKAAITPETALQLEKVLGVPARFWLKREQQYRESLARQAEEKALKAQVDWLDEIPTNELVQRNLIKGSKNRVQLLRNALTFFGVASPREWREVWFNPNVVFRKTLAYTSEPGAVAAWLRQGELEAQGIRCAPYDAATFRASLQHIRTLTIEPPETFMPQVQELCARSGVAIVLIPQFAKSRVSGATRWLTPSKALLQLSLRYKSDDQFWFSFFHEAGHILLHGKRDAFLEQESRNGHALKEEEANKFARNFLISPRTYRSFLQENEPPYISKKAIQAFAAEEGIAPGIVVGRLQHDGIIPFANANDLKQRYEWASLIRQMHIG